MSRQSTRQRDRQRQVVQAGDDSSQAPPANPILTITAFVTDAGPLDDESQMPISNALDTVS